MVCADYSQLELRIMAHQSQDPKMMEAYTATGAGAKDLHTITQESLTIDTRKTAKMVNFGLIYGMSPEAFQRHLWVKERIDKSIDECTRWKYGFFELYSGVGAYHEKVKKQLEEKGYVQTLTGRFRHLEEELATDYGYAVRTGVNTTIQGSAADIIEIAMRNIHKELAVRSMKSALWRKVQMLLQVHDELLFEAPEELALEVKKMVTEKMESAAKLRVPLRVDCHVAPNWADAKNDKYVWVSTCPQVAA